MDSVGWDKRFAISLTPAALRESNRILILNRTRREKQNGPTRVGWALRATASGCAGARFEQGSKSQTLSAKMQKAPKGAFDILAERVGFEPTKGYKPLLVFKTSAFNRSATSPVVRGRLAMTSALIRAIHGPAPAHCASTGHRIQHGGIEIDSDTANIGRHGAIIANPMLSHWSD